MRRLVLAAVVGALAVAAAPGHPLADTVGAEQFTVVKVGSDPGTAAATGVINGVAIENNDRLGVPRGAPFHVTFSFPQGDLFQTIAPAGPPEIQYNPTTCVTTTVLHDTTTITGGTNAFAGASGTGTATANLISVAGRNSDGSCLPPDAAPVFALSVVRASGSVHVP